MNPYEVLGVERDAKEKTIKAAYKKLVRKWHTDLFHTEVEIEYAKAKIQEINEAYEILKTPEKRKAYDAENPVSANVYEYYAKKQTKTETKKKNTEEESNDIEQEKQRRAVITFLEVEYKHRNEILEMFEELANIALKEAITEEEYLEYLTLIVEEQTDCVNKIQKIIEVANQKRIKGLETNKRQAKEVVEELTKKANETPRSLKAARYVEETRRLTEKIYHCMNGFADRLKEIASFNLLDKTWEFQSDSQLNATCKKQKRKVEKLLNQIKWIQKTASERNIKIELIRLPETGRWNRDEEITLEEYKQRVEECNITLQLNLKELQERFWEEECEYDKRVAGKTILSNVSSSWKAEKYKGNFICPPYISGFDWHALYWLSSINSISIPNYAVKEGKEIELPHGALQQVIIMFGEQSQIVDISNIEAKVMERKGEYIYIGGGRWNREKTFALIDAEGVYLYDEKRLSELNGVSSLEQLEQVSDLWKAYSVWEGYEIQVHTWAQVVEKLPAPSIMQTLPVSVEVIEKWVSLDKTNFERVLLETEEALKERVMRLYLALGALNGDDCYTQAEELISKLEVSKMYRSRFERIPTEKPEQDPMFSVPKIAVDFVQENIENKEFLPYVFAFLEGYQLFYSEAKKAKVVLSPEFVIATAPQYIFHKKLDAQKAEVFVKQILQEERNKEAQLMDKIVNMYSIVQRGTKESKTIIETEDVENDCNLHYRFFNIKSWESYQAFEKFFQLSQRFAGTRSYHAVEAENVFLSNSSHAIEILDSEDKRVAIVILNLWEEGELFADIVNCERKTVEVLETIKRALLDQKNQNHKVTGISIGMNEAPRTVKYNEWRKVIQSATEEWLQEVQWLKFEYLFENRILGISYKGYRARFMLEGRREYTNSPNPWDNPRKGWRRYY